VLRYAKSSSGALRRRLNVSSSPERTSISKLVCDIYRAYGCLDQLRFVNAWSWAHFRRRQHLAVASVTSSGVAIEATVGAMAAGVIAFVAVSGAIALAWRCFRGIK